MGRTESMGVKNDTSTKHRSPIGLASVTITMSNLFSLFGISFVSEDTRPKITSPYVSRDGRSLQTRIKGEFPNVKVPKVPNIGEFGIKLSKFDPLLLIHGIMKRYQSELIISSPGRNGRMNRYLVYMTYKLLTLKSNPKLYWQYAIHYVSRSNSLLLSSLWNIDKNLYRTMPAGKLVSLLKKVHEMRGQKFKYLPIVKMKYNRVYIPKDETSVRPLGVPNLAWRIYLNMMLQPLTLFVDLKPTQHGFIHGRGTLTAWKEILRSVRQAPDIFEIDLKQCFPSISLPFLRMVLINRHKLPESVARFYTSLNYSIPAINGEWIKDNQFRTLSNAAKEGLVKDDVRVSEVHPDHCDETDFWPYIVDYHEMNYTTKFPATNRSELVSSGIEKSVFDAFLNSLYSCEFHHPKIGYFQNLVDHTPEGEEVMIHYENVELLKYLGVAQGSPLSPFLANVVIDIVDKQISLFPGMKVIKYADDMIFYGKDIAKHIDNGDLQRALSQLGLTLNLKKSGFIKLAGVWLKELKFLGLTLSPSQVLRASTRKGSTLIMNKFSLLNYAYDRTLIAASTLTSLRSKALRYLKAAISMTEGMEFRFGNIIIPIPPMPYISSILSYNLYQYYAELTQYKLATGGNQHMVSILYFLRFLMELPKNVLWSLKIRTLLMGTDKKAAKDFIKTIFDAQGNPQVPFASNFMKPVAIDIFDTEQKGAKSYLDPNWRSLLSSS